MSPPAQWTQSGPFNGGVSRFCERVCSREGVGGTHWNHPAKRTVRSTVCVLFAMGKTDLKMEMKWGERYLSSSKETTKNPLFLKSSTLAIKSYSSAWETFSFLCFKQLGKCYIVPLFLENLRAALSQSCLFWPVSIEVKPLFRLSNPQNETQDSFMNYIS